MMVPFVSILVSTLGCFAVARRPSEDLEPWSLAIVGSSHGAFEVLQRSSLLDKSPHIAKRKVPELQGPVKTRTKAKAVVPIASAHSGKVAKVLTKPSVTSQATPLQERPNQTSGSVLAQYLWTEDGVEWAAQYFNRTSSSLAPKAGERVTRAQFEFIEKASGEHDLEKGVRNGVLTKASSSLLQIRASPVIEPGPKDLNQSLPEHSAKAGKKSSHLVGGEHHGSYPHKIGQTNVQQSSAVSLQTPRENVVPSKNREQRTAPNGDQLYEISMLHKTVENANPKILDQSVEQIEATIENIKTAMGSAEKAGASATDLADAKLLIAVLEEARQVRMMRDKMTKSKRDGAATIVSITVAMLLLGFVAFDLGILYMVNYPDPQVKSYSYKMLSQTMSVLCAVLLETAQMDFFVEGVLFGTLLGEKQEHPGAVDIDVEQHSDFMFAEFIVAFALFLVWFFAVTLLSRHFHQNIERLFMVGALVAHEAAFVCIHAVGKLEGEVARRGRARFGEANPYFIFHLYPIGVLLVLRMLTRFSAQLRLGLGEVPVIRNLSLQGWEPTPGNDMWLTPSDRPSLPPIVEEEPCNDAGDDLILGADTGGSGQRVSAASSFTISNDEASQRDSLDRHGLSEDWKEGVMEAEDELTAIIVAYLLRQSTLFFACGRAPTTEGDFGHHTNEMFASLGATICVYVLLLAGTTWGIENSHVGGPHAQHDKEIKRFLQFLQLLFAMAIAWHCLSLVRWLMQHWVGQIALQFVAGAFSLSPFCVCIVIVVDKMADNQLLYESTAEIIIESVGLLIGFAWEKAFYHAVKAVIDFNSERGDEGLSVAPEWLECVMCLGLVAFMLPAWTALVVPFACQPVPERDWSQDDPKASIFASRRSSLGCQQRRRSSASRSDVGAR